MTRFVWLSGAAAGFVCVALAAAYTIFDSLRWREPGTGVLQDLPFHALFAATALTSIGAITLLAVRRAATAERLVEELAVSRRKLRDQDALHHAVFAHNAHGLFVLHVGEDGSFRYEAANPAMAACGGFRDSGAMLGRKLGAVWPAEVAASMATRLHACMAAGAPLRFEDTYVLPAGTVTWQVSLAPIPDSTGRVSRIAGGVSDVTEQRATEEALHQSQKIESVGQLTGGVAHDFNNLLTAVLCNLELLGDRLQDEDLLRHVRGAEEAAQRGARLVEQLLAFARRQHLAPRALDINARVQGMRHLLEHTIGATVAIETALEAEPWPAMIDPNQFDLILLNLAINARDAMAQPSPKAVHPGSTREAGARPSGGRLVIETANVRVERRSRNGQGLVPGDYVFVSVTDTGTGMTPEVAGRAFEPFFTTKAQGAGTGLGLSQVYGILRQSGGTVRLHTHPGEGTSVHLYIPRAQAEPDAAAPGADQPRPDLAGLKVLVVDDDRQARSVIADILRDAGCQVLEAESGASALALLQQGVEPDLVLADYAMPGMTGDEMARQAQALRPGLVCVFMTGYANLDALAGADVLLKPFRSADLTRHIAAAARRALAPPGGGRAAPAPRTGAARPPQRHLLTTAASRG